MVSVMNDEFLVENFPEKKVYSVDEFLENETLCLSAANNTEVPIEGVTLFDFAIDSNILFQIPFLITKEKICNPIVGYNTIEHLVVNFRKEIQLLPSLMKILPSLSVESAEVMANTIEKAAEISEVLGEAKTAQSIKIPGNCLVRVKCKTRVSFDMAEKEILFSPSDDFLGDTDLVLYESTGTLKRGKSQFINVAIYNSTPNEKFLKKGFVLGNVIDKESISQAIDENNWSDRRLKKSYHTA